MTLDAAARPGGTDRPPGHNMSEDPQLVFCSRGRCFESRGFWAAQFHYVKLTECYRQRDRVFSGLLDRLRVGDEQIEVPGGTKAAAMDMQHLVREEEHRGGAPRGRRAAEKN